DQIFIKFDVAPMKFRALLFGIFLSVASFAQTGNYFLSHFSPDEERFNIMCFDIVQDDRGVFYFATQAGVLQFDGRNWDLIETAGTIYSIERSAEGEIYVAGSQGFGKIVRDEFGVETYQVLYKQDGAEYIFQIITLTDRIYFLSDKNLFEYSLQTGQVKVQTTTEQTGAFISLHEIFDKIYVGTEINGLFEVDSDRITPASIGLSDSTALIFALKYNDQYLLGTDDNRIYKYTENKKLKEIKLEDAVYANAGVILNATWVNEKLIAIGTLRGGVMFINPQTGKTEEIINYNTGLRDNEVFALICDKNQNVWVAHAYGFTRIAPFLPFRSFRYYPGLEGNLLCATTYRGKVYVGTSAGLFKLEKEEFYDEIEYFVEIPIKVKAKPGKKEKAPEPEVVAPAVEPEDTKKGGFFRFLRRKKKEEATKPAPTTTAPIVIPKEESKEPPPKAAFRREKRTKKILRAAYFRYKKVEGIDSKVTQLIHWQNKFIVAGLGGAYEVAEQSVNQIIQDPIRFLFASERSKSLIASTYDDRLHQYKFDKTWVEARVVESINGPVNFIFEEDSAAIWFCGFDKLFRLNLADTSRQVQTLDIDKRNFDQLLGIAFNKQVFIATSSGFYFYDAKKEALVEGDTLRKPVAYFANARNMWFRDSHSWYTVGKSDVHNNLQLLNLFSNIRFMDSDSERGSLWIITGNNELLQFNSESPRKDEVLFPLILKSIENNNVLIPRKDKVEIDQDNSSIRVEVVRPDFIGARFIEYRYKMEGLNEQWSDWSTTYNIIPFPYIPTGDYKLLIQSKDIFGRINELDPVIVEVVPPYWRQTWFYALEFAIFTMLVILSFRLSHRYNVVSRLLSLLSIIILIEFIQTAAGSTFATNSGPVVDFLIQVCVAFVILPIEGFLRRFMLRSIDKNKSIDEKNPEPEKTNVE
ncbi:MAG TPA: triple tyrosine motif-containing protein, partial [Cyclobacteriaceae bacterium]|nr:triple tyrosine motif-containing protein [Cyclobacteriaceae bacterium]